MNVIGARADGWWRDRDGAVRRLVGDLSTVVSSGCPVTVVFDGRELPDLPEGAHGGVVVFYAARSGRDAADDRIVELVAADADPASTAVFTSDRELRSRVEALGARVRGASELIRRLSADP